MKSNYLDIEYKKHDLTKSYEKLKKFTKIFVNLGPLFFLIFCIYILFKLSKYPYRIKYLEKDDNINDDFNTILKEFKDIYIFFIIKIAIFLIFENTKKLISERFSLSSILLQIFFLIFTIQKYRYSNELYNKIDNNLQGYFTKVNIFNVKIYLKYNEFLKEVENYKKIALYCIIASVSFLLFHIIALYSINKIKFLIVEIYNIYDSLKAMNNHQRQGLKSKSDITRKFIRILNSSL